MIRHLNTLFVTTQGAYLTKDGEGVAVRVDGDVRLRIPLLNLGSIACFGRVSCSPGLMGACAESGIAISFLSEHGRFLASVHGFTSGNVLLRREQYRRADDAASTNAIARIIVAAKIANARTVMLRAARDYQSSAGRQALEDCSARLGQIASQARGTESTEVVRGMEGESAALYFGVFNHLITAQREHFALNGRNRRPPLDPVNALLSFVYTMLTHDARGACEAAGLDPAVGFLHRDRPGRRESRARSHRGVSAGASGPACVIADQPTADSSRRVSSARVGRGYYGRCDSQDSNHNVSGTEKR